MAVSGSEEVGKAMTNLLLFLGVCTLTHGIMRVLDKLEGRA